MIHKVYLSGPEQDDDTARDCLSLGGGGRFTLNLLNEFNDEVYCFSSLDSYCLAHGCIS